MKPKVRARLTSLTKEVVEKSSTAWLVCSLKTGWLNSMVKATLKPLKGSKRAHLSPSSTCTGCLIRMNFFGAFCCTMPADWMRKTKGPALPSMIGTSAALKST